MNDMTFEEYLQRIETLLNERTDPKKETAYYLDLYKDDLRGFYDEGLSPEGAVAGMLMGLL